MELSPFAARIAISLPLLVMMEMLALLEMSAVEPELDLLPVLETTTVLHQMNATLKDVTTPLDVLALLEPMEHHVDQATCAPRDVFKVHANL